MPSRRDIVGGLAALALLPSGSRALAQAQPQGAARMPVVATFSILADFTRQVGGERIALTTLVAPGADAHVYAPSPADARALAAARLVVVNGLGFEGWLNRLIRSSGTKARVGIATRGIAALAAEDKDAAGHSHGHSHGSQDPHAWQSVANARAYVANIRDDMSAADPEGREVYARNAAAYDAELVKLEQDLRDGLSRIAGDRRRIITSHDAFQYFEKAYGVDFVSPRGVSTSAEPTAQAIARIIRQIKAEKITAVFLENLSDERLMKRIADETGARIGGRIYSDALTSPEGEAPTYLAMMRHNLKAITGALVAS